MAKGMPQEPVAPWSCKWPHPDIGPWLVTLKWAYDQGGHVVCVGFDVDLVPGAAARPWTSTDHRRLRLHTLITTARAERYAETGGDLLGALQAEVDVDLPSELVEEFMAPASGSRAQPAPRRERRGVTDDDLRAVARTYSEAITAGQSALEVVMRVHHLSRATASRRIARARAIGALPETTRGVRRGNPHLLHPRPTTQKKD